MRLYVYTGRYDDALALSARLQAWDGTVQRPIVRAYGVLLEGWTLVLSGGDPARALVQVGRAVESADASSTWAFLQREARVLALLATVRLDRTEAARAAAPPTRTQGLTLSASLHSLADVPQRVGQENNRCPFDYVFLSPIFDSISKTGYPAASFDEEALVQTLAGAACDVVALGGLDARTALSAARTGFAGAALLGCLWGPSVDDPVTELRAVRAAFGA
jgi:thiamine monophosphate synthase